MLDLTFYASKNCCLVTKVQLAAAICGEDLRVADASELPKSCMIVPRYPALCTPHGLIGGSNASIRYLANSYPALELYGRAIAERASVDCLLDAFNAELEVPVIAFKSGFDPKKTSEDITRVLCAVDERLMRATFLVGEQMTIADICLAGIVKTISELKIVDCTQYIHLVRLVNTVFGRARLGYSLTPCAEVLTEASAKVEPKKEKKPAAEKKAAAEKKPAEPKKSSKKDADDDDNDDCDKPKQTGPKVLDPIEMLPSTDFDMDAWKRKYSNSKDLKGDAMPYLWEKLDKEGFSFWHLKYQRYNDQDNVKVFMASNLLGMFLQRIDNWLRKYSFAVCDVFEETGYYDIEGVLLVRGKDIPVKLRDHDQFESFTWTKLEHPKDAETITAFFCEEEMINGRKIADCKVYK